MESLKKVKENDEVKKIFKDINEKTNDIIKGLLEHY